MVVIDGRNVFYQPVRRFLLSPDQGDDYTTGRLLDYIYFKESYKLIAIDLSKQQKLDADPKAIQQINFTENLERVRNTQIFFIIEKAKGNNFRFFGRSS